MRMNIVAEEKILVTAPEAARLLAIGVSTLWAKVKKGELPKPIKIGGATRWRLDDLRSIGRDSSII
jgi:predicted DNA-binding transcriptional regulator AlpA